MWSESIAYEIEETFHELGGGELWAHLEMEMPAVLEMRRRYHNEYLRESRKVAKGFDRKKYERLLEKGRETWRRTKARIESDPQAASEHRERSRARHAEWRDRCRETSKYDPDAAAKLAARKARARDVAARTRAAVNADPDAAAKRKAKAAEAWRKRQARMVSDPEFAARERDRTIAANRRYRARATKA